VSFEVLAPIPRGSQFNAEFSKPTGAPWITANIPTEEVGDDIWVELKMPDMDENLMEKKATTGIGVFPFKIRLKNELAGTNTVIFSGKYEVGKYPLPRVPATEKNKTDFRTIEDWRAPIGYLWLDPTMDENVPNLAVQMWFRGTGSSAPMQAVLFRNGEQVGGDANANNEATLPVPSSEREFNWEVWKFGFPRVRGFNRDESSANSYEGMHFLDKNPGAYEIKVLRNGKLARSVKFTVGEDGKIVDDGVATANKLGGIRLVVPVKIIDVADGKINPEAWKTQAFYGNPLTGFKAAE
jgi:hypothetical protein